MTATEQRIFDTIVELEQTIEAMPSMDPKPNLLPIFSRLDELTRTLPLTSDPLLLHYMHKKSYQKARLFLQGRDEENAAGNCHGHTDNEGRAWPAQRKATPQPDEGNAKPPER